jgi:hypothetical protein
MFSQWLQRGSVIDGRGVWKFEMTDDCFMYDLSEVRAIQAAFREVKTIIEVYKVTIEKIEELV